MSLCKINNLNYKDIKIKDKIIYIDTNDNNK